MKIDDFLPISIYTRKNIDNLPNFTQKYLSNFKAKGLCNQLFALTNAIINAQNQNKKFIIIDSFFSCIINNTICPISKIIDLKQTSDAISPIVILDRTNCDIQIISAKYGINQNSIDISHLFKDSWNISNKVNFNSLIRKDPCPNKPKYIYLKYQIGEHTIEETIPELNTHLSEEISFDLKQIQQTIWKNISTSFIWYSNTNIQKFNTILKSIYFNPIFYQITDVIPKDINIVHFRLENDAINHWSRQNNISKESFTHKLLTKYDSLIEENIPNKSNIYFLTDNTTHLTRYTSNYKIINLNSENKINKIKNEIISNLGVDGREIRGICDLIIGTSANHFIGCHNLTKQSGSSFSYYILINIKETPYTLIDLDNL